tara:strand:- start:804 stop:1079 length:276 start_codon:yes stop_codon:yes gene_type:complete
MPRASFLSVLLRRQRRVDLTCFYTRDGKTFCRQSKEQMLAQSARFKVDPSNRIGKRSKALSDVADLAWQLALKQLGSIWTCRAFVPPRVLV